MGKATTKKISSASSRSVSPLQAFLVHVICGVGLAVGFWVAYNVCSINLVSDPSRTLCLIWVIESPIVILLYSCFRQNPDERSYVKAAIQGSLGFPVGAFINALGAVALGAPVGIQYVKMWLKEILAF